MQLVTSPPSPTEAPFPERIGGKAERLVELKRAGFNVPAFVCDPADPGVALAELGAPLVVRSSASAEDGHAHSFAGQFESILGLRTESEIAAAIATCHRSLDAPSVREYCRRNAVAHEELRMGIIVQRMIEPELAGVAFSIDPMTGENRVVVEAVPGLADELLAGRATSLRDGDPRLERHRARIEDLARRASGHFGAPQDIEFAIQDGELFLLQSRPITAIVSSPALHLWDNSNIVESYRGRTSILTFTFARRAYEGVYRQFCRILSVPEHLITANDTVFKNMLGHINGHIYYDLLNWYRILAILPGYRLNSRFMEQMMGVTESLSPEIAAEIATTNTAGPVRDSARLLRSLASLLFNLATLERQTRRFQDRLASALRPPATPLSSMTLEELAAHYRELEDGLLTRWDAPLLNDFYCMIFYGLLKSLTAKDCPNNPGLHDELLQNCGDMISAQPAARLQTLAALARAIPGAAQLLANNDTETIRAGLPAHPELAAAFHCYLEDFGERCLEELKLETPTLHDEPLLLFRAVGRLASANPPSPRTVPDPALDPEARLEKALAGRPLRRLLARYLLRQARARVRQRENLRFERTRVFGRIRRIFVEIGKRLHDTGHLDAPRDIFDLEINEALGNREQGDFRQRVARRRAEKAHHRELPPPPRRFETRGETTLYLAPEGEDETVTTAAHPTTRKGLGCSPGTVRGIARVILNPREARLEPGDILVAEATDPGWIMLFPLAAGIIVERGSPLSHSAIVARELGIPAVVALEGATRWIKDGQTIALDGATGTVRILETNPASDE